MQKLNLEPCQGDTHPQHIPTLEQALAIMPHNIWINVDMKNNDPHVAKLVAKTVAKADLMEQVIFSARNKAVSSVRQIAKETGRDSWVSNMSREGLFKCRNMLWMSVSLTRFKVQLLHLLEG